MGIVAALAIPWVAQANGRFPAAGQILRGSGDGTTIVRATYGAVVGRGDAWGWVCEEAIGYSGVEDPMLGLTASGRLLAALSEGLAVSDDGGCTWAFAAATAGTRVTDLAVARHGEAAAQVVVALVGTSPPTMLGSIDAGATWTQSRTPLPLVDGLTIDVGPYPLGASAPRLYASGIDRLGVVARSDDAGATWSTAVVPQTNAARPPYLAAIDPYDPDVVYVRVDGEPNDELLVSSDGGATFATSFKANGALLGFALSPDGADVAIADDLGVWRAPAKTSAFARVSSVAARCLTWTAEGLFACADEARDGFTVGLSRDRGATFSALFRQSRLCGPLACTPASVVATTCGSRWPAQRALLGAETCEPAATTGAGGDAYIAGGQCALGRAPVDGAIGASIAALAVVAFGARRAARQRRGLVGSGADDPSR